MAPPRKEMEQFARRLSRRGAIVLGLQGLVAAGLGARLVQLQVRDADAYALLAEENRINFRILPPARGAIYDRFGVALAVNAPNYRAVIVREEAGDVEAVIAQLRRIVPMDDADVARALREIKRRSSFVPVSLAEQLDWEQVAQISLNAPALPGITAEVGLSRHYPLGNDTAHVVGYVGPVSDADLARLDEVDPLLLIPRFQIGKTGVEERMEAALRGKAGTRRIEVNAVGRVMREIDRNEGVQGADIQLTIDSGLQNFAMARLGQESASAVVLDVASGDILALASAPGFDGNKFVRGISSADWRGLNENDHRPLSNKTVQGAYPPGSTFKMVVALAALEAGITDVAETVRCPGHYDVGTQRFHCWKRAGHGNLRLREALAQSCDVYFYDVARRVGIDAINAMSLRLGLGVRYDLPVSASAEGVVPDRAWKQLRIGEAWLQGDTVNAGIGQGFVLTTPLQLAVMTARLGSGNLVTPRLVRAIGGKESPARPPASMGLSPGALREVQLGMVDVVNARGGTAGASRIAAKDMQMAGKTGTSQVRRITQQERERGVIRNEDLPWERRDHALFVAYAPVEAPRYAVSVVVEHGGGGSAVAAPIARDIMLRALYGAVPPLDAYPAHQRRDIRERLDALPLRDPAGAGPVRTRA